MRSSSSTEPEPAPAARAGRQQAVPDPRDSGDSGSACVRTGGRWRRQQGDAGERLHDDEDVDLDFIDADRAPDTPGGAIGMQDEDDNIPGAGDPRRPPDEPDPAPDQPAQPGQPERDDGAAPAADEPPGHQERRPGHAALLRPRT